MIIVQHHKNQTEISIKELVFYTKKYVQQSKYFQFTLFFEKLVD